MSGPIASSRRQIEEIIATLYRVPPATAWEDATHRVTALEFIVIRLSCSDGAFGTGITYTVGVGGTAVRALIEDYCVPALLGLDASQPVRIWSVLWQHLHRTGSGGLNTLALAGIDTALWDLAARRRGEPLARLLGGANTDVPAYASGIDLHMEPVELRAHLESMLERGYEAAKIKVGRPTLEEDIARLEAARAALGTERRLLLDANQSWTVEEAITRARAFERFRPHWLEEPLAPEDIAGHARLRQMTTIPIAVGESLYSKYQFLAYLQADAVDVLQPDIARIGGFTEWIKVAHLADAWHRRVSAHYLAELSVHAMCAVTNIEPLEDVTGGGFSELGISPAPAIVDNGRATVPERPGHGIELDLERLESLRIKPGSLRGVNTTSAKAALAADAATPATPRQAAPAR